MQQHVRYLEQTARISGKIEQAIWSLVDNQLSVVISKTHVLYKFRTVTQDLIAHPEYKQYFFIKFYASR